MLPEEELQRQAEEFAQKAEAAGMSRCRDGEAVFYLPDGHARVPGHIYSEAGRQEFGISGYCEYHFDKMTQDPGMTDLELQAMALDLRATYWRALGDEERAVAEPSEESLTAWSAVANRVQQEVL